jgi:hypothetical protein
LTYDSANLNYGNGTISVYVVNDLTVPNSSINNDIEINVFVSAHDDFEVAVPSTGNLTRLRLKRPTGEIPPEVEPQAGEVESVTHDSKPQHVENIRLTGATINTDDKTNLIYFGEVIRSFRQVMKRYTTHAWVPVGSQIAARSLIINYPAFPFNVGDATAFTVVNPPSFVLDRGVYTYGHMTLLNYLSCAYGGWRGGIRWMVDASDIRSGVDSTLSVERTDDGYFGVLNDPAYPTETSFGAADMVYAQLISDTKLPGSVIQTVTTNPILLFEVPYYKNMRFTPARRFTDLSRVDTEQNGWVLQTKFAPTSYSNVGTFRTSCAAAEDLTFFMFLGAPIFYFEFVAPNE